MEFVHLHVHSSYSLLSGASRADEILDRARALGMSALALTDTNGLYGAVPFYEAAKQRGIKPILGAQIEHRGTSAVCLIRDRKGYANLCRIITAVQLAEDPPAPPFDDLLAQQQDGLTILCRDSDLLRLLRGKIDSQWLYAERHKFPGSDDRTDAALYALARDLDIPVAATNNVHFAHPDAHAIHRVLTAIRKNILVADRRPGETAPPEAYLKSEEKMRALFRRCPEAIKNTVKIAEECAFEFEFGKPIFPHFRLPEGETAYSFLWKLAFQGASERYKPLRPDVLNRLEYELEVINTLGFAEYFIIVWDIVNFAKQNRIPIVGRGSAADSLVSYCLGITSVDPIAYNLYFERFLNLSRTDCPDIDLDMCWRRRDEVLDYVYRKYGADRVAMIANHNSYQARSAFRDVGRVLALPLREINLLSRMLPYYSVASIRDAMQWFPETRDFPIETEPYKTIVAIAEQIDGFIRHLSIHVGGIVIAPAPLTDSLPLERATKGIIITQYDMGPVEDLGLVKIDLLGQRSLSIITDTLESIERNYRKQIDIEAIPDGDPKTAKLLREGKTIGCFQIESPGMRNLLQMMQARCRLDVIHGLSLLRPGPSGSGMKERFIKRRLGREPTAYLCPKLKDVLSDTYGVMLYQEDILRVAEAVAGFTLAEGDELRKAISKGRAKSAAHFAALHDQFLSGAGEKGVGETAAKEIWDLITNFASYSYCKAHATTYGHISYQATYLKAHYPAEFLAAVVSNLAGFYETAEYIEEARRFGIKILLPDVNKSDFEFLARNHTIRIGLMQVRGLSQRSAKSLLRARRQRPFASLADFRRRVHISRPEIEHLILCGAMDGFGRTRPQLLWQFRTMRRPLPSIAEHKDQMHLPLSAEPPPPPNIEVPSTPDYTKEKKLRLEQDILQLAVSDHPLYAYRRRLAGINLTPSYALKEKIGQPVTVVGWLVTMRRAVTKKREYMKFMTIEDKFGTMEIVLFPDAYQKFGDRICSYGPYLIRGTVEGQYRALTITAEDVAVLDDPTCDSRRTPTISIGLDSPSAMPV